MHMSCPRISKPVDLRQPGAISQLIAFHRETFGGWTMEADPPSGGGAKTAEEIAAEETAAEETAAKEAAAEEAKKAGFPAETKVEDMTAEQQAAYWRTQARKHETRSKQQQQTLGGKTAEQLQADAEELETLRAANRSASENAVADAKKEGKAESDAVWGSKLVAAKFESALAHLKDDKVALIVEGLDLTKFITAAGEVDTDKVKSTAAALAPPVTEQGNPKDFGAGRRRSASGGTGQKSGSIAAVIAERREAREAKSKTNV